MRFVFQIQKKEIKNIVSIDLGLENFVTIVNNIGLKPIVIKGKVLKSINQYYNKEKAKYQSILEKTNHKRTSKRLQKLTTKRNNKIKDYTHKVTKYIIKYCKTNNIDTVIIGYNKGWKQEVEIGKKNNQNFTGIPFDVGINQILYKAENKGIKTIIREESYTSKSSFLDNDLIPINKKNSDIQYQFSGKRIKRGLYQSNNGTLINADVNGAYNIMKKEFPNAFADGIEGVGLHPLVVKL